MYSGVISVFSERIKNGLPITIYGDGGQTRDFVSVADVVQANLLAMTTDFLATKIHEKPQKMHHVTGGAKGVGGAFPHQLSTDNQQPVSHNFVVLNVATGHQTSLLELLDTLEAITGHKVPRSFAPARSGDIRHSAADISKVRKISKYAPNVCLKDGLSQLIEPIY
jgi:UDP-glucose 4-epimerase